MQLKVWLTGLLLISLFSFKTKAQGHLSGDLMVNFNVYDKDTIIGTNTTQYNHELTSSEGWLFLNYRIQDWEFKVRYDFFHNSPLLNPQEAFTDEGIAFYQVSKPIGKLDITGGYFYDQIGSGIIFRAFEDRTLGLDYAIQGLRLKYNFSDNFRIKAFSGRQKYRFDLQPPVINGLNIEKDFNIGKKVQMYSGVGIINRTLPQETMDLIVEEIKTYDYEDRFIPKYNMYSYTLYNTLNYKALSWYVEYAGKTKEAIRNEAGDKLINRDGYALYSAINLGFKGFGISLQYRKNKTFILRTSPYATLLEGVINYLPPITQQQSLRLPARYSPQPQAFGEEGYQMEITYSPNTNNTLTLNMAYVNNGRDARLFSAPIIALDKLQGNNEKKDSKAKKLYHEIFLNYYRKWNDNFKTNLGIQSVNYDREVYQGKPGAKLVKSVAPFSEFIYRLDRRKSLRTEIQYLFTDQDLGDFFFGLVEFNIAPKYSISVSDMINTHPRHDSKELPDHDLVHYYSINGVYRIRQTRFSLGYVKQVEGVVCTGGICRVEPAFSGLRFGLITNF